LPDKVLTGEFAGRYTIDSVAGHGATSIVYKAVDRQSGRAVAIKVLREELAQSLTAGRFLQEIDLVLSLSHPSIVPVLDRGETDRGSYVVLPFMEGGTLRHRLDRERQLPMDVVVRVTSAVAAALDYAHSRGVLHRDVKPENILFTGGEACLADFGIARALERALGETSTTTGIVRGTPAYMSPEQAAGDHNLDARSDVYALGCVAYEMIAGMAAFLGPTQQSVMVQRITHRPRPIRVYRPSIPAAVERVIELALEPAVADRWQSAGEFAAELRAAVGAGAAHRTSSGAVTDASTAPPARSKVRISRLAGMLAAVLVFGTGVWVLGRGPSGPPPGDSSTVIAVIPFVPTSPADTAWGGGVTDVLSQGLDGAGPLRTVPPSVVARTWRGEPLDTASAGAFARRVGAGIVVYGLIGHLDPSSLRLTATLFDAVASRKLDEVTVEGADEQLLRLTDIVTTRFLARLARDRPIAAARGGSFASISLPVLKEFLRGEQLLRRNQYAAAESAYKAVYQAAPGFALGLHRLRRARRGLFGEADDSSLTLALAAGRLNRGLSVRDSLIIRADSLIASLRPERADAAWPYATLTYDADARQRLAERFRVLNDAARRYPEDPEIWLELGEARHHYGDVVGVTAQEALEALEHAIAADSNYLATYSHAIELAIGLRGPEAALALLRAALRRDSTLAGFAVADSLLSQRVATNTGKLHIPEGASVRHLRGAAVLLLRWKDADRPSEQLFRAALARGRAAGDTAWAPQVTAYLAYDLLYGGRAKDARALLTPTLVAGAPHLALWLGEQDPESRDRVDSLARTWSRGGSPEQLLVAADWLSHARDLAALSNVRRAFEAMASRAPPSARASQTIRYGADAAAFYAALGAARSRSDSVAALQLVANLPDSLCLWRCQPVQHRHAALALALGRPEDAAKALDAHPPSGSRRLASEVTWHVLRARAADSLGDDAARIRSAAFVAAAWQAADSVPQAMARATRR
jgi:serine/threonine-protein kinase